MVRRTTLDQPLQGFKIGDLVKYRKPSNEYESNLILVVRGLDRENDMLHLGIEGSSYYSYVSFTSIKKESKKFKGSGHCVRHYRLSNRMVSLLNNHGFDLDCYRCFLKDKALKVGEKITRCGNHLYHRSCYGMLSL